MKGVNEEKWQSHAMRSKMGGHPINEALRSSTKKNIDYRNNKSFTLRIPFAQREKAAYLYLRKQGLSINTLSKAFGRSASTIQRIFKRASYDYTFKYYDFRKIPYRRRMQISAFVRAKLAKLKRQWEAWMCGEGDKPP